MVVTQKQRKKMPYTDEEINEYCESVDKLLKKIKEEKLSRKRKKAVKLEVEEEVIDTENEDHLVFS